MVFMTYNLYFETNKQAHISVLSQSLMDKVEILIINTDAHDEILTIEKTLTLVSSTRTLDDKIVHVSEVNFDDDSVYVTLSDVKTTSKLNTNNGIVEVEQGKDIVFRNIKSGSNLYQRICIHFIYNDYSAEVLVHCVPSSDLYDVVLDFGSEASQMLIKHISDGGGIRRQHLFANMLKHYWQAVVGTQRRVYDQQDDDSELFRSIFFKKDNSVMSENFETLQPNKHDDFINFITKRTRPSGERIPNVKISFLTGRQLEGTDRSRLHVGIIMRFLHEAVKSIIEMQHNALRDKSINTAIRFTVLLPNVMPQTSVSKLISRLQCLANSEEFRKIYEDDITIPYIQISSCSESDASFLNRMNSVGLHRGDRCLTIDIGKGTTDFSITRYLDAHNATSIFRSGFVGAGNAISYAIFENYVKVLAGDRKKDIVKKVLDAEPALLYDLDNLVEEIKRNWSGDITDAPTGRIDANATVEVVLDRIRANKKIGDKSGYVQNMAVVIADNILSRLPNLKINKIIISGRAFQFKILREVLEKKLNEKFRGVKCIYNQQSAKSGCLFGASSNIRLSLSSAMVGLPLVVDATEISDSDPKEVIKEVAKSIDSESNIVKSVVSKNPQVSSFMSWIAKVKDIFSNPDEEYSYGKSSNNTTIPDDAKELMSKGKEYARINSNSLISISGRFYVPSDQYVIDDNDKPFSLYFDGREFWLRHRNGMHKLVAAAMQGEQNLCFESQFPYSRTVYQDDSNIPN